MKKGEVGATLRTLTQSGKKPVFNQQTLENLQSKFPPPGTSGFSDKEISDIRDKVFPAGTLEKFQVSADDVAEFHKSNKSDCVTHDNIRRQFMDQMTGTDKVTSSTRPEEKRVLELDALITTRVINVDTTPLFLMPFMNLLQTHNYTAR